MNRLNSALAAQFADRALEGIGREYPVGISHVATSVAEVRPQRALHPVFYGCFDWHSAVHSHWLLARTARLFPSAPVSARAIDVLDRNLSVEELRREAAYFDAGGRAAFERPYGLAWLLQLSAEIREWDCSQSKRWLRALRPLERRAVASLSGLWSKLSHPVRSGVHSQTAFSLALALDYARSARKEDFEAMIVGAARRFYIRDREAPLSFEPSGHDFLSPALAEADLMRRVLRPSAFAAWFARLVRGRLRLAPVRVVDPSDGHSAHFAGLNISRAWMLEGIAAHLAPGSRRRTITAAAAAHRRAGLRFARGDRHYAVTHWLGTFVVYLETRRGLESSKE